MRSSLVTSIRSPLSRAASATGQAARKALKRTAAQAVTEHRVRLDITQGNDTLQARLVIDGTDLVQDAWVRSGDDWLTCGEVRRVRAEGSSTTYDVSFDLAEVAAWIARRRELEAPPPGAPDQVDDAGTRATFYVGVSSPSGSVRPMGYRPDVGADPSADQGPDPTVTYRDPIGRYDDTSVPDLSSVATAHGRVHPYINRKGVLSVVVGAPPPPAGEIRNDGLSVRDGVLKLRGAAYTRHVDVARADLVVQGRTTGYRTSTPLTLTLDETATRRHYGLRAYTFTATYSFVEDLADGMITDDVGDLYIEFTPKDGSEAYKRRVGKSRYRVRVVTRGGAVTRGDQTLSIEPYYTFKAKNPSLQFELFDADVYQHLRRRTAVGPTVRAMARRTKRPVWIVGELPYKAQDNGLHLFRYLREEHPEIDAYYVIRDDSPERRNLEGYEDHVLSFRSKEHIDRVLEADRIVGTHQADFLYPSRSSRLRRRVRGAKVFLQHGVTGAKWMVPNYGKKASGFETSLICVCSEREKQFFVSDFGYSPSEVSVTGFARFDALFHDDVPLQERQIVVMPTWRPWLQDLETFTESDYFKHWRDLLNSSWLSDLEERTDARIILCLHPNMQQFSHHFASSRMRVVVQGEVDVQFLIKESAVLVTDYSSVAFDFAFLRKPVIYYQFDADRFHAPHAHPRTELPGPVAHTGEGVRAALEGIVDSGWAMSEGYADRAARFCAHVDEHNRERIFRAVRDLEPSRDVWTRVGDSEAAQSAYRIIRRNKRYQPTMQRLYRLFKLLPMDANRIVFESGQGRHFSDSPRYIYEELVRRDDTRRKVWIYNDKLPEPDPYTTVVKRQSVAFYWHLARAKYWVNNHTFPHYITRRPKGQYIQTWHGTPLKRMFLDQEGWFGRDDGYKDRVTRAVAQWSVLVSPSPYATECMRTAYAWRGPVVEVGYPRNDILLDGGAAARTDVVRGRLGIDPGKRVVLYAPTFRDDRPTSRGRFAFEMPFDLLDWHRAFGDDHVLLVRTHVLVSNRIGIPPGAESSIIDASGYPDIQELFLASDVLVTDYSSSFFDFALLGRPIVFHAPDLEDYRDRLRGFYLPYGDNLPGTITRTEDELFRAIRACVDRPVPDDRVVAFARVYAPHDDGHASARVVDRLL